jgi:hypothetical protein
LCLNVSASVHVRGELARSAAITAAAWESPCSAGSSRTVRPTQAHLSRCCGVVAACRRSERTLTARSVSWARDRVGLSALPEALEVPVPVPVPGPVPVPAVWHESASGWHENASSWHENASGKRSARSIGAGPSCLSCTLCAVANWSWSMGTPTCGTPTCRQVWATPAPL